MGDLTKLEDCFVVYQSHFDQFGEYLTAVTPCLVSNRRSVPVFVESSLVLMVAWHEGFLKSIVSHAARERETPTRSYLVGRGVEDATTCGLPMLLSRARGQIKFKNGGKPIDDILQALLGFSPWPNTEVRSRILDLNLLRQMVVHHTGATVGDEYWNQLSDKTVVKTTQYGDLPAIRRIDHERVLLFVRDAAVALNAQLKYVKAELLSRPEWIWRSTL